MSDVIGEVVTDIAYLRPYREGCMERGGAASEAGASFSVARRANFVHGMK